MSKSDIDPELALQELSEKFSPVKSQDKPFEISGWGNQVFFNKKNLKDIPKYSSPEKLPKLKVSYPSINFKEFTSATQKLKHFDRVYLVNSPYKKYPPSIIKTLNPVKGRNQGKSLMIRKPCPSPELYNELKEFLNFPSYPKRDISLYRKQISKAMNTSETIEELLKYTKIPASKLLKVSQTGTDNHISPFREFKIDPIIGGKVLI